MSEAAPESSSPSRRALAIGAVSLGALLAAAVRAGAATRLPGQALTDLALGQVVAAQGVPARDPLSWSAGPWVASSWLGERLAFAAWRAGGIVSVGALEVALVLATCVLAHALARRRASWGAVAATFLVLGAAALTPATTERWSLALFAAALLVVEQVRERPTLSRAAPLAAVLAAAGHLDAGFVAVFGAVLLRLMGELARRAWPQARLLAGALALGALSFAAHPSGFSALARSIAFLADPRLREVFRNVPSLGALDFTSPLGHVVELTLVLLVGSALVGRTRPRASDVVLVVFFAHAALTCRRAAPFFVVAAAGPLAAALRVPWSERLFARFAPVALALGLAGGLGLGHGALLAEQADATEIAAFLRDHEPLEGNLWNEPDTGGALEWTGSRKVWIDERSGLFADAGVWRKHVKIVNATGSWIDLRDRHHMDLMLVRRGAPLELELHEHGWRSAIETPTLLLLVRPASQAEKRLLR